MGTKRQRSQARHDAPGPSNKKRKPSAVPKPHHAHHHRKPGKPSSDSTATTAATARPKPEPLNPARTRIRSLRRLLAHDSRDSPPPPPPPAGAHPYGGSNNEQKNEKDDDESMMDPSRAALLHLPAPTPTTDADRLEVATKHGRRDEERRARRRLPADVRVELERELASLEGKVREGERRRRRSEMIGRWHRVRFFERRRGERRLRRLRKLLVEGGEVGVNEEEQEEEGRRRREVHEAEVDLNYALYWPLERDYVSLWPRRTKTTTTGGDGAEEGEEEDREVRKGDPDMWLLVEKCMAEGRLEDLREGRVEGCGVERDVIKAKEGPPGAGKSDGQAMNKAVKEDRPLGDGGGDGDDGEESDGGFFEKA